MADEDPNLEKIVEDSDSKSENLDTEVEEELSSLRSELKKYKEQEFAQKNQQMQYLSNEFQRAFRRAPESESELTQFSDLVKTKLPSHIGLDSYSKWASDFNITEFERFIDSLPKKDKESLKESNVSTLRWVSDIQDFGGPEHNLTALKKIIHDAKKELNPENSALIFGGDVFYDVHITAPRGIDRSEADLWNLNFLSDEDKKHLETIPEHNRRDVLDQLVANKYLSQANRIISTLDPNLFRGHINGNNEYMPFLKQGISVSESKQILNSYLSHSFNLTTAPSGSSNSFFEISGIKTFSDEFFDEKRNKEISDTALNSDEVISKNLLYDDLVKEKPQLIMLHGQPTYFYKGRNTWRDLEPEGLNKYLDEYDGDNPLYVLSGHTGKQRAVRKKNSKGRDIILLNSNVKKDSNGNPVALSYDLKISDGTIKGFSAKQYFID